MRFASRMLVGSGVANIAHEPRLQPIARLLAEEATEKLGGAVTIDTMRPLQAFDSGGRARAMLSVVQALAMAKAGEVSQADMDAAFRLVDL